MIILRSVQSNGKVVDSIYNDHISISEDERKRICDSANRRLVRNGKQLEAIYLIVR